MSVSGPCHCRHCCRCRDRRSGGRVYYIHHRVYLISKPVDIMGARVNLFFFLRCGDLRLFCTAMIALSTGTRLFGLFGLFLDFRVFSALC